MLLKIDDGSEVHITKELYDFLKERIKDVEETSNSWIKFGVPKDTIDEKIEDYIDCDLKKLTIDCEAFVNNLNFIRKYENSVLDVGFAFHKSIEGIFTGMINLAIEGYLKEWYEYNCK